MSPLVQLPDNQCHRGQLLLPRNRGQSHGSDAGISPDSSSGISFLRNRAIALSFQPLTVTNEIRQ